MENEVNIRSIKIKSIIKKIPFTVPIYRFFKNEIKYWFYSKSIILDIQGSKMYLNVKDKDKALRKTFRAYAKYRIHEETTTELLKSILKSEDVFIDLGANIGYFSLLAAKIVGKKGCVFSFEPETKNYKYLNINKELNKYNQLITIQKALSNVNGKTNLFICPYDTGHHTINQIDGITSYETSEIYSPDNINYNQIETITLDDFMSNQKINKVDLIKMDVEGAEMLALAGMEQTIKKNDNIKMIIEYFPLLIEKMGSSPEEFLMTLIKTHGFILYEIENDYNAESNKKSLLKPIKNINDILKSYAENNMFHINLFVVKKDNEIMSVLN